MTQRISLTQPASEADMAEALAERAAARPCPTCGDTAGWCPRKGRAHCPGTPTLAIEEPDRYYPDEPTHWEP